MGRQWNTIIESLGPLTGGSMSISANLTDIEALLTTLQADVADGITVSSGTVTANVFGDYDGNPQIIKTDEFGAIKASVNLINTSDGIISEDGGDAPAWAIQVGFEKNGSFATIKDTDPLPISGTVTAAPIRGTTTTGTLTAGTTNGTLFATNSTRNYLLVQCTSGTVFIDTNGTASATEDIQLTAGQGITWEGSFIPTGAIAAITSTGTARVIGVQG